MPSNPRAVLTRPAAPPDATVRYGEHPDQIADVRLPADPTDPAGPLVVVIHGGVWRAEYGREHTGPLAAALAAHGYAVAQLEYRRTGQPGGGWPGTFADVATGVAALPALVSAAGGRPRTGPPILLGHSAGAHLALWCAADAPSLVGGVLALAPVADLTEAYRLDLDGGAVRALLGGGPHDVPDRYAIADPIRRVSAKTQAVVVHGILDEQVPVGMSRGYAEAAEEAGGDVRLLELPDCEHFGLIDPLTPAWPHVLAALRSLHN
ncbi:MAG TPA: alpha/beta hydrolase [Micromonospora sp.]